MRREDLDDVLRIERASFAVPWSERTFRALLERSNAVLLAAEERVEARWATPGGDALGPRLVGYAVVWLGGGEAELGDLAVEEGARRRGIGAALVKAALEAAADRGATAVFLEVRESNRAARRLYERAGFEHVGTRKRYYVRPVEDALVMRRSVPSPGG